MTKPNTTKPEITILYEDEHIVAINKPAGLMVHGDGKSDEYTVADWMLETYPASRNVGEPMLLHVQKHSGQDTKRALQKEASDMTTHVLMRPGIVHRLDKETSGVMLLAKTVQGFESLKAQFQDRTILKTYHAFVHSNIKEDSLSINLSIGRSSKNIRKWSAGKDARGELREALTNITVRARGKEGDEHLTFIEAQPKTGRTHQIRVHCKAIERPIVGDSLYAPGRDSALGFKRLALHAARISFTALNGERITITAPYPEDFEWAVNHFKKEV
jgi:23S rRNA pseudouridine1911/1915/1917 synthase